MYIQPSFLNSCEEHGLWSGGNDQYRGDRSVDFSTFDKNGRARVEAFSDAALEANKEKRKTSVPLKDRILPQARRVAVLTEQLIELEQVYRSGNMSINEYSTLRAVLVNKRNRSQVLYERAISVKEPSYDDLEECAATYKNTSTKSTYSCGESGSENDDSGQPMPSWLSSISNENSLKNTLIKACKVGETLVRWHQKARNYINELKAL
jgi:hypothetical protein